MSTWVQHKSGIGEKWEVFVENQQEWCVFAKDNQSSLRGSLYHYLPNSEYVRCEAPEVWEEVKVKLVRGNGRVDVCTENGPIAAMRVHGPNYRVKSLVMEKRRAL